MKRTSSAVARAALVGWTWFVVTLMPVLGIVQVGAQAVADRYTYVPTIGVLLAVAFAARTLSASERAKRAGAVVAIVIVAACAWRTWVEIAAWRDPLALAAHAVAADPEDHDAHVDLAVRLGERGDFASAIQSLERAVRIKSNAHTWDLLGQAYARAGRPHEAIAALETATTIDASLAKVHVHLAETYATLAMPDDAMRAIDAGLAIEPTSQRALAVRARLSAP